MMGGSERDDADHDTSGNGGIVSGSLRTARIDGRLQGDYESGKGSSNEAKKMTIIATVDKKDGIMSNSTIREAGRALQ